MVLPTFGQKRNQRGEKMVSYVIVHDGHGSMNRRVDFLYDENNEIVSMVHLSVGNGLEIIKTKDGLKLTRYVDNKPEKPGKEVKVRTNDDGYVDYMETREYLGKSGFCFIESWNFDYVYNQEAQQYTLWQKTRNYGDNEGNEEILQWRCSYTDGVPSMNMWDIENKRYREESTTFHSNIPNDLNINLPPFLFVGNGCFAIDTFIQLSPWCPIVCKFLPDNEISKDGKLIATYKYTTSNGRITMIEQLLNSPINKRTVRGNWIEIGYVES